MTDTTLREQMYRRWKKGEDYYVLAKEMGVTRERMRIILKKMDAEVPLVDRIEAQAAEIERLRDEVDRLRNAAAVVVVIHREAKEFGSFRSTKFITALSLAVSDLNDTLTGGKDE